MHPSPARRLVPVLALALVLAGCGGRSALPTARAGQPASRTAGTGVEALSVAPDHTKIFEGDLRRAAYWRDDARLIMAVHTTGLNTTKIAASCNVFFSDEAFHEEKPAVFVARHYGFVGLAQFAEMPDYNKLAFSLKPIDAYAVKAEEVWSLVKKYAPEPAPSPQPGQPAQPVPAGEMKVSNAFFIGTRSFLVNTETAPEWCFYANKQKFVVNAQTKAIVPPVPQLDPNDRLNTGLEVDLQRASMIWMPSNMAQGNNRKEPKPTN